MKTNKLSRRQWLRVAGVSATGLAFSAQPSSNNLLYAKTPQSRSSVANLVRLNSNENPYGPSPAARAAMTAAYDEACRYPFGDPWEGLTKLIAKKEGVSEEYIVIGSGSSEILCMTGMTYGMDSGEIIAADPTYQGMLSYAERLGGFVHRVPLGEGMVHDLEAMAQRITSSTKLVFICNPNNPTATICEPKKLKDFCISNAKKTLIFVDEAYIDLLEEPEKHTMMDLVREGHNLIVSRTFSKIHGLAGMRIGYAIARPDIISRISKYRMVTPNVLGLRAAAASYQDVSFQNFSKAKMASGRKMVYNLLDQIGFKYTHSHASFVFFHTGMPIRKFQQKMKDRGILIARPFPPYLDWARVSIGTEDDMKLFAVALKDFAASEQ